MTETNQARSGTDKTSLTKYASVHRMDCQNHRKENLVQQLVELDHEKRVCVWECVFVWVHDGGKTGAGEEQRKGSLFGLLSLDFIVQTETAETDSYLFEKQLKKRVLMGDSSILQSQESVNPASFTLLTPSPPPPGHIFFFALVLFGLSFNSSCFPPHDFLMAFLIFLISLCLLPRVTPVVCFPSPFLSIWHRLSVWKETDLQTSPPTPLMTFIGTFPPSFKPIPSWVTNAHSISSVVGRTFSGLMLFSAPDLQLHHLKKILP